MKNNNAIIQLLIISDQNTQMNQLVSCLRTNGLSLRVHGLGSEEALQEQLNVQQWDLVVYFEGTNISIEETLGQLKQLELDTPLLFISTEGSTQNQEALFKLGVHEVIPETEKRRIAFSIKHEASNHQLKQKSLNLELALKELENRHQTLLNDTGSAISYIRDGMHVYCNSSYAQLFSHPDMDSISEILLIDLIATKDRIRFNRFFTQKISMEERITVQAQPLTGESFEIEMVFTPLEYEGQDCLQLSIKTLNRNTNSAQKIDHLHTQDLFISLDNSRLFTLKTEAAIREAIKLNTFSSLLIIQLDEFIDTSSIIGKSNANIVIRDISKFLQNSIQKPFTASRLSDHEFGLILYNSNPEDAIELAKFIKSKIKSHITATALPSLELNCSIGIAVINGKALEAEDIIAKARSNLNTTLQSYINTQPYDIGHINSDDMLNYLKEALAESKFTLRFQAIVNIKGAGFACYEILARMLDDNNHEILPPDFIPLANLNGLGEEIDRVVVLKAIDVLINAMPPPPRLVINITSNSLTSKTFLPWLSQTIEESGVSSDLLLFQLSEIDIYNNLDAALEFCKGLDKLKLKKTISHFGCAVNPFEYLAELKPEHVKLDISIISDLFNDLSQMHSVRSLISRLHKHKCLVVAPQVEEIEVLPLLWEIGANYAQGYCLQRPSQEMNYEFNEEEEITLDAVQHHH